MTITFRVEDSHDIDMPPPVPIEPWQMGALREVLAENGERIGTDLIVPEYGNIDAPVFAWEARTAMLAVAAIARCFDYEPGALAIIEEAQFRCRRLRISRPASNGDILLSLSTNPDSAPELNVSNSNAFAILDLLGIDRESCGLIPLEQLQDRLRDPAVPGRIAAEPGLARYLPTLTQMAAVTSPSPKLRLVWA
ncbi:hypothetical protein [Novosphingobium album (ex Hu et al. 2023)]|uniref:Uncharacterized protein n=1 Tax=Novosphingobium album (ex Hu et al. 2023) TaxID=2930093 RepID=A0ABT0B5I1_9SPHN|nr:hypothetical protein [Novosphingobium album (ex Hu et al. 2023)]MCJ2180159.1 hypothetical protein [Novosphingobium album (ex Hu et al. 2023)]